MLRSKSRWSALSKVNLAKVGGVVLLFVFLGLRFFALFYFLAKRFFLNSTLGGFSFRYWRVFLFFPFLDSAVTYYDINDELPIAEL